jgi:hypothetical protein
MLLVSPGTRMKNEICNKKTIEYERLEHRKNNTWREESIS